MNKIIKQIRQKDGSTFSSPINLGAEQRYVGALRQSHNDNLEEQSILGVDCVTTETWSGTIHKIVKEFHDGTQSTNFYILTTEIYNEIADSYVDGKNLILPKLNSSLVVDTNLSITTNEISLSSSFKITRKDILSYKNDKGEIIEISTKITQQKKVDGVITTKEVIDRKENINGNN